MGAPQAVLVPGVGREFEEPRGRDAAGVLQPQLQGVEHSADQPPAQGEQGESHASGEAPQQVPHQLPWGEGRGLRVSALLFESAG